MITDRLCADNHQICGGLIVGRKKNLYDYLYRNLKEQILNGYFACGERLPSLNELCEMYHVGIRTAKDVIRALKRRD